MFARRKAARGKADREILIHAKSSTEAGTENVEIALVIPT